MNKFPRELMLHKEFLPLDNSSFEIKKWTVGSEYSILVKMQKKLYP